MRKELLISGIFLGLALLLPGCGEKGPEPGPGTGPDTTAGGSTVVLEQSAGSSGTLTAELSGNWTVVGGAGWFEVSPANGFAGSAELTVTASESNGDIRERVGSFEVVDGSSESPVFYVVQRGVPGMEVSQTEYTVSHTSQELTVEIPASAEYTAESSSEWLAVSGIEYGIDSTLLEDGETYSMLRMSRLTLSVSENTADASRTAEVTLVCDGQETVLSISQLYPLEADVDWSREFYRRSLYLKFTGSGCGYCPRMIRVYEYADAADPGRIEEMNVHGYGDDGVMYYADYGELAGFYGQSGFPSVYFNSMVHVETPPSGNESMIGRYGDLVVELEHEARESYPARSAVQATVTRDGDEITLDAIIAVKEALEYEVSAFVLENGVIADQKNYDGETYYGFGHNAVLRYAITAHLGEPLDQSGAETLLRYTRTFTLPVDRFVNADNGYILLYVSYKGHPEVQGVPVVKYMDLGEIVDNVFVLPLEGHVDFAYED